MQYSTSLALTLEVKMMLYLALYTISQSERGRTGDKMVMSRFTTRITFSTDQSDFVSSFVLHSQVGSVHVVLTLVEVWVPFFFFCFPPRLASSAAPSGTVRIEVNVSVWNEMLPFSCGRFHLYVACYSRRNNTAMRTETRVGTWTVKWNGGKIAPGT